MKIHEKVLHRVASANNAKRLGSGDYDTALGVDPIFLRVDTAGDLEMEFDNGETITEAVLAGEILYINPTQINSAGTTAVVTAYW